MWDIPNVMFKMFIISKYFFIRSYEHYVSFFFCPKIKKEKEDRKEKVSMVKKNKIEN